jgi:hypothetical protein
VSLLAEGVVAEFCEFFHVCAGCMVVSPIPWLVAADIGKGLTPKISSDQISVAGYFGQTLTYP